MAIIGANSGAALAESIGWQPINSGGTSYDSDDSYNRDSSYESSSGNQYQYNLNKPTDRIRYEHDPSAQIRDKYNPRTNIDRNQGQYGGGIYNDWPLQSGSVHVGALLV